MVDLTYQSQRNGVKWTAGIMPACGGHCIRLAMERAGKYIPLFDSGGDEQLGWRPTGCGCPILFPYANRVDGSSFVWGGKRYNLPVQRHGLVRLLPWEVADRQDNSAKLRLALGPDDLPWHCLCLLDYCLDEEGFGIKFTVKNLGGPFPYTCGFHPYLDVGSWHTGVAWHLPVTRKLVLDSRMIPTGEAVPVREVDWAGCDYVQHDSLFGGMNPVKAGHVACCDCYRSAYGRLLGVHMSFSVDSFPFLCLYTPPGRTAVCFEPYSGATDALNHLKDKRWGARVLEENGEAQYEVKFSLRERLKTLARA